MRPLILDARQARRLLIDASGLSATTTGPCTPARLQRLVERLGFVQVDSVQALARAHHHILFSRNEHYRESMLAPLVERRGSLFEQWTNAAAVIPSRWFPHWHHRFDVWRDASGRRPPGERTLLEHVRSRIEKEGALQARDFRTTARLGNWWGWSPEKRALEYLWRTGELAIAGRSGFEKVYDLVARVIPEKWRQAPTTRAELVDWACRTGLERLGFATARELAGFWRAITAQEAASWLAARRGRDVVDVITAAEAGGSERQRFALAGAARRLRAIELSDRLHLLNPFDPLVHHRDRLQRFFGFDYRIEIYVPESRRLYGYYILPVLEGDRFIGRIDVKADRRAGRLRVERFWPEAGVTLRPAQRRRLDDELQRTARFIGVRDIQFGAKALAR